MAKISLAMIVRNEVEVLGSCLRSARPWVDEMVVIDTGSTDGTADLARSHGALVFDHPWRDDFSEARNVSLRHCSGDWVLVLDADEELEGSTGGNLRQLALAGQCDAFLVQIRNYLDSGAMTALGVPPVPNSSRHPRASTFRHQVEFWALRFFRRHPWVRYTGRVHELVDPCFEVRGFPKVQAEVLIHHFGKTMAERETAKRAYYLELARADAEADPVSRQAQFNYLQQAFAAWQWPQVLQAAKAYIGLESRGPSLVLLAGAVALQELGRQQEAMEWFKALLDVEPDHAVGLTRMGVSQAAVGDMAGARRCFERAQSVAPHYTLAYLNQAEMERAAGEWTLARRVLEKGLSQLPVERQLWQELIQLGAIEGHPEAAARDAWRAVQADPEGGSGEWHRLVVLSLARLGQLESARIVLDLGLGIWPDHEGLGQIRRRLFTPRTGS